MGFGKKKDPETNRTIDLDETYKKIIRPAVEACDCKCVRADEIVESGIIDRSMYALLYKADIVIADISTYNPNAIYELGVRHSLKAYSTIIIKEDKGTIPFDLNHDRILSYSHLGDEISSSDAKKSIRRLKSLIDEVLVNPITDSPLYSFIPKIQKPILSDEDLNEIIGDMRDKEDTIYALTERAKEHKRKNEFTEAASIWKRLSEKIENEIYYIQQQALCTYKSENPSKLRALTDALTIITTISEQTDTETLGISGAIYKRLWEDTTDISYLDKAIELYQKGWYLYRDYYTGENYAHCLEEKSRRVHGEEKVYYEFDARKIRNTVIEIILTSIANSEPEELKWKYATLANCYLAVDYGESANEYELLFLKENPDQWEVDTFSKSKDYIINSRKKIQKND